MDWTPSLVDYLYVSLTNATAFSPTDTMPLTPMAKWLMSAQSLVSLVTVGLVLQKGNTLVTCVNKALDRLWSNGTIKNLQRVWLAKAAGAPVLK